MQRKFLNLGCSAYRLANFINIDIDTKYNPDVVADVTNLPYERDSIDFIYAGHIIEHIDENMTYQTIQSWHNALKPGSCVMCVAPDASIAMQMYKDGEIDDKKLNYILFANGEHKQFFDQKKLIKVFSRVFESVHSICLNQCPYLLVSDVKNPVPDKWQSGVVAIKL